VYSYNIQLNGEKMFISIDENSKNPIYQQIADEIRLLIVRGELEESTTLPSVRQLANDLGVNLNTVASAYRELQNDGLLTIKHGAGAIITSDISDKKSDEELRKPLRSALAQLFLSGLNWAEVMNLVIDEMRGILKAVK
jgi:GntR family transcriptional regulator